MRRMTCCKTVRTYRDGKTTYEGEPSPTVDNGLNRTVGDKTTPTLENILDDEVVKNGVL